MSRDLRRRPRLTTRLVLMASVIGVLDWVFNPGTALGSITTVIVGSLVALFLDHWWRHRGVASSSGIVNGDIKVAETVKPSRSVTIPVDDARMVTITLRPNEGGELRSCSVRLVRPMWWRLYHYRNRFCSGYDTMPAEVIEVTQVRLHAGWVTQQPTPKPNMGGWKVSYETPEHWARPKKLRIEAVIVAHRPCRCQLTVAPEVDHAVTVLRAGVVAESRP